MLSLIRYDFHCLVDSYHQFNKHKSDWGFTSFMTLTEFYDPSRGYLVNDTLVVEVDVICDAYKNDTAQHLRVCSYSYVL